MNTVLENKQQDDRPKTNNNNNQLNINDLNTPIKGRDFQFG